MRTTFVARAATAAVAAAVACAAYDRWRRYSRRRRYRLLWAKLAAAVRGSAVVTMRPQLRRHVSSLRLDAFRSYRVRNEPKSAARGQHRTAVYRKPIEYDADAVFASNITGFLIDLDGTMYTPDGLIPGALELHEWLVRTGKPFVYLSNTGGKNSRAVQKKFLTPPFVLDSGRPLPLEHIFTASDAQ
eukprot:7380979-Prymnesium_polylepis.1